FLRSRFFAKTPAHRVPRRTSAPLDREIPLPAFLPSLPCDEWQSLVRRFCSTSDLAGAQKYLCKRAVLRRALSAFSPNAAHDALLLPPCAGGRSCVFHPVRPPLDRESFARPRLPPSCC